MERYQVWNIVKTLSLLIMIIICVVYIWAWSVYGSNPIRSIGLAILFASAYAFRLRAKDKLSQFHRLVSSLDKEEEDRHYYLINSKVKRMAWDEFYKQYGDRIKVEKEETIGYLEPRLFGNGLAIEEIEFSVSN